MQAARSYAFQPPSASRFVADVPYNLVPGSEILREAMRLRARTLTAAECGRIAEDITSRWLEAAGWKTAAKRLRWHGIETDIVAVNERCVLVCEVKYRASMRDAAASLSVRQRERLRSLGELYLERFGSAGMSLRFDAFLFSADSPPVHLANAF